MKKGNAEVVIYLKGITMGLFSWGKKKEKENKPFYWEREKVYVEPPFQEPDLSTKPEDVVEYRFGLACANKHFNKSSCRSKIDITDKNIYICNECGRTLKHAVIKATAKATWEVRFTGRLSSYDEDHDYFDGTYYWKQYDYDNTGRRVPFWTQYDFERFVNKQEIIESN